MKTSFYQNMEATKSADVIIIGGGPAGMSAALWCDELGLTSVVIEGGARLGGQLHRVYNPIKNYPGLMVESGIEMLSRFEASLASRNFVSRFGIKASSVDTVTMTVRLDTNETWTGRAIVLAMGVRRRVLGIPGESEFIGHGILESGVRDKNLVKGKRVFIVGGGDAAFENAITLSDSAASVAVAFRRSEPSAREEFVESAARRANIELLCETVVTEISGGDTVERVATVNREGAAKFVSADAVLIRIGVVPNSELVRGAVTLDESGYITVDHAGRTSADNVYAAGDIANPQSPTISSSVGDGATVVKSIFAALPK